MRALLPLFVLAACLPQLPEPQGDSDSNDPGNDLDDDGFGTDDCDDTDASVNPGASEVCNDIDDDCDGSLDEDSVDAPTFYADTDSDGAGDPQRSITECVAPPNYVTNKDDCDDANPSFHPGAVESDCGDPADYNCDGSTGYADADTDGWAACQECDDANGSVHPGAAETCNEVDDDCNTVTDDDYATDAVTWYADTDGDAYGDAGVERNACDAPGGYVPDATDCNDLDATVNPGAVELCNNIDDNCDIAVDETSSLSSSWFADTDGDTYGDPSALVIQCDTPAGHVADNTDCVDTDSAVNPAAVEVCNEIDDDCDGLVDDDDGSLDLSTGQTWYFDADGDGSGTTDKATEACVAPDEYVENGGDCDDAQDTVNPDADEVCNETDDDCDGLVDDDDDSLDLSTGQTWYLDADLDGAGTTETSAQACAAPDGYTENGGDCDDAQDTVNPDADEVCNETDDDCDGLVDDDDDSVDLSTEGTWYFDGDLDGTGTTTNTAEACAAPEGYVADGHDCDDSNAAVSIEATEVCNEIDDDCDTETDEDDADDAIPWYDDLDADGYGGGLNTVACDAPTGTVTTSGDCDDDSPTETTDCGAGGLMVYVSDESGDAELWTAELDGHNPTQLTSAAATYGSGAAISARFSPDGERIAFLYSPSSLMIVDVPSGDLTYLGSWSGGPGIAWSPDGTTLYSNAGTETDLYAFDIATGVATLLTTYVGPYNHAYLCDLDPNTSELLINTYAGAGAYGGFYTWAVDGSGYASLGFGSTSYSWITGNARYAPGFERFAYVFSERFGTGDYLRVVDLAAGTETEVLDLSAGVHGFKRDAAPPWSPDATKVYVTMLDAVTSQYEVHMVEVATGIDTTIFADPAYGYGTGDIRWAPDFDEDGYTDAASGGSDCDDGDKHVSPAATEAVDGRDNDCDGLVDE